MKGRANSASTSGSDQSCRTEPSKDGIMESLEMRPIKPGGRMFVGRATPVNRCRVSQSTIGQILTRLMCVDVLQQNSHKNHHADILIVQKGPQAPGRVAIPDQPLLVEEQQAGRGQSRVVPLPEMHVLPREHEGE